MGRTEGQADRRTGRTGVTLNALPLFFEQAGGIKRAMMAPNRSPEFKSSYPKPSAAELFGTQGHHLSKIRRAQLCNPLYQFFKHLSQVVLKQKFFFFILPMYFYALNPEAPGVRPL